MHPKIAVLQMTSLAEVSLNLQHIEKQLSLINDKTIQLVVLPENFAFMGHTEKDKLRIAEPYNNGPIQTRISQMAKKYNLWIVAGTLPIISDDPSRCFASSLVFDAKGQIVARYDKVHLFDVRVSDTESHKESNSTLPGRELCIIDTPVGRLGLSVCYDLRFPEFYRELNALGAEVLIVPAAFTFDTGKVHWHTLLKARAIENLSYVIGANQGGLHENGRKTYGHSVIISPWGHIEAHCEYSDNKIITADINLDEMKRIRQRFPCLNHRKM